MRSYTGRGAAHLPNCLLFIGCRPPFEAVVNQLADLLQTEQQVEAQLLLPARPASQHICQQATSPQSMHTPPAPDVCSTNRVPNPACCRAPDKVCTNNQAADQLEPVNSNALTSMASHPMYSASSNMAFSDVIVADDIMQMQGTAAAEGCSTGLQLAAACGTADAPAATTGGKAAVCCRNPIGEDTATPRLQGDVRDQDYPPAGTQMAGTIDPPSVQGGGTDQPVLRKPAVLWSPFAAIQQQDQ